MNINEKYWLTILLMLCRYLSIIMMGSGILFVIAAYYITEWFYLGLIVWPLLVMWGVVNMKYLRILERTYRLDFSKIVEKEKTHD